MTSKDNLTWTKSGSSGPAAEADSGRGYRAFQVADRAPDRLELCQHHEPTRFPSYSNLADIVFDSRRHSIITLIYSFAAFYIEGENLGPLVQAIASGNCSRVTLFNPAAHDKPAAGQPLVTKIECAAFSYADKLKEATT